MSLANHPRRPPGGRGRVCRRSISYERVLTGIICQVGLPAPVLEHPFSKPLGRKHRFDLAWPDRMLALEIDGGVWVGGRHNRGQGFIKDQEKSNLAALLGWRVLRCTPQDINQGKALELLRKALA